MLGHFTFRVITTFGQRTGKRGIKKKKLAKNSNLKMITGKRGIKKKLA
jgi:hypothetical protein